MKPYPNYKGNKLKDINPTAIALVTEGANRKKFCLFKLKQGEVSNMKKETALALIKSGKLSDDEVKLIIDSLAAADQAEVKKVADEMKKPEAAGIDIDALANAIADKLKGLMAGNDAQLTKIAESLKQTTTILEKLSVAKAAGAEEDPELTDEQVQALVKAESEKAGN